MIDLYCLYWVYTGFCPLPLDCSSWRSSGHLVETTREGIRLGRMGGRQPGLIARQVLRYNYTPYYHRAECNWSN